MTGNIPAVYMAVNNVNGKKYIGATSKSFQKRKRGHLFKFTRERGCPRFYDALKKYGQDAFDWHLLKSFRSAYCAFSFERIAIHLLKPEYNVTYGGYGALGLVSKNRCPVICLEDGIVYESATAAAKAYGTLSGEISAACNGKRISVKDRHFIKFKIDMSSDERLALIRKMDSDAALLRRRRDLLGLKETPIIADGRDSIGRLATGPMSRARRVRCLDTGDEFPSASAAAKYFDVSKSAVIEVCLGKNFRRRAGGYKFEYIG